MTNDLSIKIRKAQPEDAPAVWKVANDRSRSNMLTRVANEQELGQHGFLLYPLKADSEVEPNYRQRIEYSDHFWVAAEKTSIVAYCMGYSFLNLGRFIQEKNDKDIFTYFTTGTEKWNSNPHALYLSQWATLVSHKNRGIMQDVTRKFFEHARQTGAPYVVCEIAQSPLKNEASTALAEKIGMKMVATRTKTDPATGHERVTGIFLYGLS